MLGGARQSRWDVGLSSQIPIALRVNGGVGNGNLDLSALNIPSLNIDTGVGSLKITTPKTGVTTMRVNGGVGSATIIIPPGVAARIHVNGGLGSTNVDQTRFPKAGDIYQSANYTTAESKIDIDIDGGVGSVNVR
jgi:predicted membrane protein